MEMKKIFLSLLSAVVVFLSSSAVAFAGTDLSVNCAAIGSCSIAPAATPLYNETGWVPGSTVTQRLSITNASSQSGFSAVQVENYSETQNLGQVISIQIHKGSPAGPVVYSAASLITFRNDGYFTLASLNAGQTDDYYFVATMSPVAGNEYQASMVKFDLKVGLEIAQITPPSGGGGGDNGGGGGSVEGTTTPPAPVCNDQPPTSAPNVTITNLGANTVTLSWTAVSPADHYGLFFTRLSDGAPYGAPNIGNVTTYTITNLSGGANYSFQVFGVNGCAPGPRSGAATGAVLGGFIAGRPIGNGGQVLGATTATPSPTPSPEVLGAQTAVGQVEGAATAVCSNWKMYVPWILLIVQFLLIFFFEYRYRGDSGRTKHFVAIGITILSIVLFYLLRDCPCYGQWSWMSWLCKWYWLVALLLTVFLKGFSYAFLDETNEKEEAVSAVQSSKPQQKTEEKQA
jgi:hypothetical protein